jgi:hypothetical protein
VKCKPLLPLTLLRRLWLWLQQGHGYCCSVTDQHYFMGCNATRTRCTPPVSWCVKRAAARLGCKPHVLHPWELQCTDSAVAVLVELRFSGYQLDGACAGARATWLLGHMYWPARTDGSRQPPRDASLSLQPPCTLQGGRCTSFVAWMQCMRARTALNKCCAAWRVDRHVRLLAPSAWPQCTSVFEWPLRDGMRSPDFEFNRYGSC